MEPPRTQRNRSLELILGSLPLVLGLQLLMWIVYLPVALRGNADFRNCYTAGMILRSGRGHQLYDYELQKSIQDAFISQSSNVLPYVHLPYEALLFAPLSSLSYRNAFFCFLGFNLLCLFICYRMLRRKLGRLHALWRWFPILFVIGFMPIAAALMQGQDSLITLLLFASALISLEGGNDALAGFLVGLAMFKFQIVLPIAGLFFLWRKWRFVFGASSSIFLTLAVSATVAGINGLWAYVLSLRNISTTFTAGGQVLYLMPVSRMPNLRGLIFAIPHLRSGLATALVLILSLVFFALAAWSGGKASTPWQFAIAVSAAAVLGYHVLMHDLSILLIPMAILLDQRVARGLWNVPIVWLSTPLCFFAHDNVVAFPVLGLFLFLVWRSWRTSADNTGASKGAPACCAFYALELQALRRIRLWGLREKQRGRSLVRYLIAACLFLLVIRVFVGDIHLPAPPDFARTWSGTRPGNFARTAILNSLSQQPGQHLIITRYSSSHDPATEWVYNRADIDNSKVVWARDMGEAQNLELIRYFKGRKVWLLEPDLIPPKLSVYPTTEVASKFFIVSHQSGPDKPEVR